MDRNLFLFLHVMIRLMIYSSGVIFLFFLLGESPSPADQADRWVAGVTR